MCQQTNTATRTYRNTRDGRSVTTSLSKEEILKTFLSTAKEDNWLWYWLAQHAEQRRDASPQTLDMMAFLGDSFLFAVGMGLQRPMIRLHFSGRRYKIYLSQRGTLCFKSGRLVPNTNDPEGDEEYMGCLTHGKFLPNRERTLLPSEREFLDRLSADPAGFFAQCSKDMDRCCYCGKPLEDARSKQVGYGATCAVRWGLPWGTSYNEKVPSFAELWCRSNTTDRTNVRGVCSALRENPYDPILWSALGDLLEEAGYERRPSVPERSIVVPRVS